jgi:hypothetical protein
VARAATTTSRLSLFLKTSSRPSNNGRVRLIRGYRLSVEERRALSDTTDRTGEQNLALLEQNLALFRKNSRKSGVQGSWNFSESR